jgi:hypothetical protein
MVIIWVHFVVNATKAVSMGVIKEMQNIGKLGFKAKKRQTPLIFLAN